MPSSFGPLLRSLRQSSDLTIEELSHASGVSVRAIGDMERGVSRRPQRRTVQALAAALRLDAEQQAELADAARAGRPRADGQAPEHAGRYELPRGLADFVGRTTELDRLRDLGRSAAADGPPPVAVLHGAGGLGKTACAVRAAELLREFLPDGSLYVDLRGVDPEPLPPAEALHRLLRAAGLDPRAITEDEHERAGQLRAVLTERRLLVVLDNAADEAQVRPLLPAQGASMVIVTSRRALGGLEGVTRMPLAPLSAEESTALLEALSHRTAGPEAESARVAALCGHLPLALRIAGTRLASRPGWTMRHLADRLADEDRRLANLAVGDVGVEASFSLSYLALAEPARSCFRRLALVPAVDFGAPIAAVLVEADLHDAEDQLDELVELGLLQHEGADRYRFHDLIRLYAQQRLHDEEPAEVRTVAERRTTDWLMKTATAAGRWFDGDVPPAPSAGLVPLTSTDEAQAWLLLEKDTWLAALRSAAAAGRDEQVATLGEAMRWFAADTHQWSDTWLEVFGLTRAAVARLGDERRELWHMNRQVWVLLVSALQKQRDKATWQQAVDRAMEVYRLAERLGSVRDQADAVCNAAEGWRYVGDFEQMLWAFSRGLELARSSGYHQLYFWAGPGVATALDLLGRRAEAFEAYRDVLRAIDDVAISSAAVRHARSSTLLRLTEALISAGRFQEAVDVAEEALDESVRQGTGWPPLLHWLLGQAYARLGVAGDARTHLTRAIELAERGAWRPSPTSLAEARSVLASLEKGD